LLEAEGIPYRYRDYRKEPLSVAELRRVVTAVGVPLRDLLRRNDRAFRELGLTGEEPEARLLALMAEHPTLLQRPIGRTERHAVLGRPVERLLELA